MRALGVGFPYAVTVALFGGTAEYVALYLKEIGHEHVFFWYVTACIFVSLLVYALHARHPSSYRHGTAAVKGRGAHAGLVHQAHCAI